ncbi:O-antigen ligase family protein [Geomonas sp.]|uniref:O-antigen ligase family protein n=1 Tax=Geomonas sp. TaxID=2651584 RepID=UPI002B49390F|nr:O-antigen ligase family protein [Geomonas sp.]HJV36210.1 O-antigen ligase family protein [Geomonas sp.]
MPSLSALSYMAFFFSGCLATVMVSPFFGVLLYELTYLTNPSGRWWYVELPEMRYSMAIMIVTCISFLLRKDLFSKNRVLAAPQAKWLIMMTLVMLTTSLWAIELSVHWPEMLRLLKVLLFVLIAYKTIDTALKMEAVLAVYVAGISYLSFIGWQKGRSGLGRLEGIGSADGSDANGTSLVVGTAIPLLIFYVLFGRSKLIRFAALGALVFNINSLILLNSRGACLAVLASVAWMIIAVFKERCEVRHKAQVVGGVLLAGLLLLYLADDTFWMRMTTLQGFDPTSDELDTHRVDFWMATFDMLKEYPLGGGARTFLLLSPTYLPAEWLSGGRRVVHSMWFETLSEYGYHGLIIFICYVVSSFRLLGRCKRALRESNDTYHLFQATTLEASWLSLLVASSFVNDLYGELTFWLPAFIAAFGCIHLGSRG